MYRIPRQIHIFCYKKVENQLLFLLLKRSEDRGSFWQGITGSPIDNEGLLEAANRELFEETQIKAKRIEKLDISFPLEVEPNWQPVYHPDIQQIDEYVFCAEVDVSTEPILSQDHTEYEWINFSEAVKLLKWPNNKKALAACVKSITGL